MIVAMTRDGKLKVEAITDEFVTLDASTRTDVMAKLDAIVTGGDMDSTYRRYDGDVNVNAKGGKGRMGGGDGKGKDGRDDKHDDDDAAAGGGGNKKSGKRRASGTANGGGGGLAPKRRKASAAK
jgi:hypothetical protein